MKREQLRKERSNNMLCVQCGRPVDRIGLYCIKCNTANNKSKHERVIKLHRDGKCSTCGKLLDRKGWFCIECVTKLNNRSIERNMERREQGLCVQCGEDAEGYSYCQRCRDMRMERYYKRKTNSIH